MTGDLEILLNCMGNIGTALWLTSFCYFKHCYPITPSYAHYVGILFVTSLKNSIATAFLFLEKRYLKTQYCVLDQNLGKRDCRIGLQLFTRTENSLKSCFSNINPDYSSYVLYGMAA